jgi:hypothetical protein
MTPILFGRWQSRIFLLATIGVLVTLPFALSQGLQQIQWVYFWVLLYVCLFGLVWDILYNYLQRLLWDHDWPGALSLITGIVEGIFLALIITLVGLPNIPQQNFPLTIVLFGLQLIWVLGPYYVCCFPVPVLEVVYGWVSGPRAASCLIRCYVLIFTIYDG